jgi:hypothetical protein
VKERTLKAGDRVKLSAYAREHGVCPHDKDGREGTVTRYDGSLAASVLWNGLKHPQSFHIRFLAPAPRRRKKRRG